MIWEQLKANISLLITILGSAVTIVVYIGDLKEENTIQRTQIITLQEEVKELGRVKANVREVKLEMKLLKAVIKDEIQKGE